MENKEAASELLDDIKSCKHLIEKSMEILNRSDQSEEAFLGAQCVLMAYQLI